MAADSHSPSANDIAAAVRILKRGGLVAFPTETVYGLGADATDPQAVARIFAAKGRPSTNPLIVHVADIATARRYALDWPPAAQRLAEAFWPGPLSLILRKAESIPPIVTAGASTVALRVPNHPLALELLRAFGGPLAAPSANLSNRVSPTTAEHVRQQLGDRIKMILDGGPCRIGIESTVLSLVNPDAPVIYRQGGVSRERIEAVFGPVGEAASPSDTPGANELAAVSPGLGAVHYAPIAQAFRFELDQVAAARQWQVLNAHRPVLWLAIRNSPNLSNLSSPAHEVLVMPHDAERYAQRLYAVLHAADVRGFEAICVEMPPPLSQWAAVRDRLTRATRPLDAGTPGER